MKINAEIELKHVSSGEPLRDSNDGSIITLGVACVQALVMGIPDEQVDGAEKYARYQIASKFSNGGEVELTAEEIVKIKGVVGVAYTPLVVGPVFMLLEGLEQGQN